MLLGHHATGEFQPKYNDTIESEEIPIKFSSSNYGPIIFNVHDVPGENGRYGYEDYLEYFRDAHCAFFMFDVMFRSTYKNVTARHSAVTNGRKEANLDPIPMVLLGNKVEFVYRKVKSNYVLIHARKKNLQYCEISVKANFNAQTLPMDGMKTGETDATTFFDFVSRESTSW